MKQRNEKGIAHLGVIIAALVVTAAIAFGGWYVWQKNGDDKTDKSNNSQVSKEEPPLTGESSYLSLTSSNVRLTLPKDWTYTKGSDQCRRSVTSDIKCEEGAVIIPGAKLPTRYGNGTEFFSINISVYENPQRNNSQDWLTYDLQEGATSETGTSSRNPINGYDTYYWKYSFSGDSTEVEEVYYAFTKEDKAVLIYARIYEPGVLNDGTQVGDFRQFESAIANMAKTIKIQ